MAQFDRYTGMDVKINVNGITANFQSIEIHIMRKKWEASASDSDVIQRGSGQQDCSMTIKGWDSSTANSATFDALAALVDTKAAPSALTWTTSAATPVSKVPANFFTRFPLASWRIDDAKGGSAGADKPGEWTITLTPNNLN